MLHKDLYVIVKPYLGWSEFIFVVCFLEHVLDVSSITPPW